MICSSIIRLRTDLRCPDEGGFQWHTHRYGTRVIVMRHTAGKLLEKP